MNSTLRLFAAGLLATLSLSVRAEEAVAWRLFVGDHAEPRVTAIDLASGSALGAFPLASPATLYATPGMAGVYAVQGAGNRVTAIATGIALSDHGDHGDIELAPPSALDAAVEGTKPVHFVAHDGQVALFFDGDGKARVVAESDWLAGKPQPRDFATPAPHHGVAIPFGDRILISEPNKEDPDALPVGIVVLDAQGKRLGDVHACPDLHGEAASGHLLAIACATGLLVAEPGDAGPDIRHLPYPEELPEGKVTTLLGGVGLQYFLGNYGADRIALIDPADEKPIRLVDLPTRRVHFAVDPVRPKFAYVFTEDGSLHRIDVVAGAIIDSLGLTQPYSMDGEWSLPRPRIAVAGDAIVVTDPLAGRLHVVDAERFAKARELPVAGKPYTIVAVGGAGESH